MLGPGNIVVSGETAALAQVEAAATELGASRVIPLAVAGAFHTRPDEARRRPARRGPGRRPRSAPPASPSIPTSTPRPTDRPGRRSAATLVAQVDRRRPLGRLDAADARRRLRHLLRDRPRPRPDRPPEADRPQDALHERPGALNAATVGRTTSRPGSAHSEAASTGSPRRKSSQFRSTPSQPRAGQVVVEEAAEPVHQVVGERRGLDARPPERLDRLGQAFRDQALPERGQDGACTRASRRTLLRSRSLPTFCGLSDASQVGRPG